jgi:hypothetical protein
MKTKIATIVLAFSCSTHGQGVFQNLNFESANVPPSGRETYPNFVPVGLALPGWTAYVGAAQQTQVGYNAPANGTASITLIGPTWNAADTAGTLGIIDGNYSVDLQTGANPLNNGTTVGASIEQLGAVPSNAQSLQFDADETTPLSVTFNGNELLPIVLASGLSADGVPYTTYGANISAWAGQTGELEFTADVSHDNFVVLDDISFSPQSVPEPSPLALTGVGALAFALYRRFAPKR